MSQQIKIAAKDLKAGDILKIDNPYGYGYQRATVKSIKPRSKDTWINPKKYADQYREELTITYDWKGTGFYCNENKNKELIIFK